MTETRREGVGAGGREEDLPTSTDGLVGALGERVLAQFERGSGTLRLALAETRLAASSAALLLAIAVLGAALAIVAWLLLMALVGYLLWLAGVPLAAVLLLLLAAHAGAAAALALVAKRLSHDLAFARTRRALAREEISVRAARESGGPALP